MRAGGIHLLPAICRGGALLVILTLAMSSADAVEELIVGRGGVLWTDAVDEANNLSVEADSIWIWRVEKDQNLGPLLLQRGGSVVASVVELDQFGQKVRTTVEPAALRKILDGDAGTAFNPDSAGVPREVEIIVDLGGTFRISEVRFYPRLDGGHRSLYLQAFELGYNRGVELLPDTEPFDQPFNILINAHPFEPNEKTVVFWPRTDEIASIPEVRYLRIKSLTGRAWEIAELEIETDGSVPQGEFLSRSLEVRNASPVWGRLRYEGGDISELPIVVQTRTGPDPEPQHYYVTTDVAGDLMRVERIFWESLERLGADVRKAEQGPVLPNPDWSPWETVTDGLVRSPPFSFLQFRVRLLEPGVKLEQLAFEFTSRPLAQVLEAEIAPLEVDAGAETEFVLSLQAQRLETRGTIASGFRYLEVLTPAELLEVERVMVQDEEVFFTVERKPGEGFRLELLERIAPEASFVQIFFCGRVFVDGTSFQVRALDIRSSQQGSEEVYQFALPGDVDPRTPGGELAVRLSAHDDPLVDDLRPRTPIFTPNGDGINDFFELSYNLLRLTRSTPVSFEIFDLNGRMVSRGETEGAESGRFLRLWNGLDSSGERVPPGLYLYAVRVEADVGTIRRQGLIDVAY